MRKAKTRSPGFQAWRRQTGNANYVDFLRELQRRNGQIKRRREQGATLAVIGDEFGITRQRVLQIVGSA